MSSSNLTIAAANLNNIGATLLASGDRLTALATFGAALTMMCQAEALTPRGQEIKVQTDLLFQSHPNSVEGRSPASPFSVSRRMGSLAPRCPSGGGAFLYNEGLVFGGMVNLSQSSLPFYIAVIMFNVGLTFHVKQPCGVVDQQSLRLASGIYEIAICSLVCGLSATGSSGSMPFAVLLNNKAEADFHLGERERCLELLEGLWAVICNQQVRPPLEECELDGFLYNCLCFLNSPLHASMA
jgi:hypothetical protein